VRHVVKVRQDGLHHPYRHVNPPLPPEQRLKALLLGQGMSKNLDLATTDADVESSEVAWHVWRQARSDISRWGTGLQQCDFASQPILSQHTIVVTCFR
jgi:hypothetical protein